MSKFAVITGASKGIGRAAAEQFLAEGYRVVNISRSACNIDGVVNLSVDMQQLNWLDTNRASILGAVDGATEIALVHNSAVLEKDRIDDVSSETMRRVLELNVVAPIALTGLLLPKMSAGSSVLYISSTLGRKAVSNSCSYVTSKHAIIGTMRATCQDLVGTGVHTAAICPGFTDTEMLRSHIGTDPAVEADIASTVAMGRLIEPEEIARVIVFAAGNPVLNGALIDANLGQIEQ